MTVEKIMHPHTWQLQEAETHFKEVIKGAIEQGAQNILLRGKPVAVVISEKEYKQLKTSKPSFVGVNIDLSPISIDSIEKGELKLKAKKNCLFELEWDKLHQFVYANKLALGISVYAKSREALVEQLNMQIAVLWRHYALASDDELTPGAKKLKLALKSTFVEKK